MQNVTKLRMVDDATAEATWILTGRLGVLPLSVVFTSTFKLDLITGMAFFGTWSDYK